MSYDSWKLATPPEYDGDDDPKCIECGVFIPFGDAAVGVDTCARCDSEAHPEQDLVDEDLARGESNYEDRP